MVICGKILEQSRGARNRIGIGLPYRPAKLNRLAESIHWNRFLGSLKVKNSVSALFSGRECRFADPENGVFKLLSFEEPRDLFQEIDYPSLCSPNFLTFKELIESMEFRPACVA